VAALPGLDRAATGTPRGRPLVAALPARGYVCPARRSVPFASGGTASGSPRGWSPFTGPSAKVM